LQQAGRGVEYLSLPHFPHSIRGQAHASFSNLYERKKMIIRAGRVLAALIVAGTFIWGHGSGYAQTSTWKIDPAHSSVNFEISHMAVSHVHGSLTNVSGIVELNDKDITKSSVEATIDTTTVSTGVVMRDNTLKSDDFFNVQKYPQITFRSSWLRRNKGTVQLLGNLTLNGVTRSVTLDLDGPSPPQTMSAKTISGLSATGLIRRSDFTFGSSKFNTVIGVDVKFTIDVEIEKQ
jgi:polyisoprenoid-binding protein YceI